jgi:putative tricarboxylic transport membrane protein
MKVFASRIGEGGALRPLRLAAVAAAVGIAAAPGLALAQAAEPRAPKGPIELTIGTSAGGTPDVFMRRVAKVLNEEKIVENAIGPVNRVGGSWMVAANHVLNRPKDENLVLVITTPLFATPIVQGIPTVHDRLTAIGLFIFNDVVLIANPSLPVGNLKELVDYAKKNETRVKYGGAQAASTDRIVAGLVEKETGLKLNYIPFDGGGAALAAFLGGNVDLTATSVDEAIGLVKAGKAKPLAILTDKRRPEAELKDLVTAKEQGFDIVYSQEMGLFGPPNLDPAIIAWWDERLRKMVASRTWDEATREMYLRKDYIGSDRARAKVDQMHDQHQTILKEIGLAKT